MTVSELLEELHRLAGCPELRPVVLKVIVGRPYATDATMECNVTEVRLEYDTVVLKAFGYLE